MRIVHFVAVNYHGAGQIGPFLASLRDQTSAEWSMTIVDNSEDPAEADELRALTADEKHIDVVATPRNLGYFGAARWWYGQVADPTFTWLVVGNLDLSLERGFVEQLVATDHGQYASAPAVTHFPGGYQQNPFMVGRPSLWSMRLRALGFHWRTTARLYAWASATVSAAVSAAASAIAARRRRPVPPDRARTIYAAHGSIIPIHRRYFDAGGTLDHRPFMFGEEIALAEQVRRLGGSIRFEPSLRATHRANQATGTKRSKTIWRMQRDATRNSYRLIRMGEPAGPP